MKTKKAILTMLLTVMSIAVYATDGEKGKSKAAPRVEITTGESNVYRVLCMGKSDAKTTINIWNAKNKLVFTETIKNLNAFVRPYNFSQMPDGVYTLEVIEGNAVSQKVIYHGTFAPTVEVPVDLNIVKVSPVAGKDDVYKLTIIKGSKTKANIRIYDQDKKMVYSTTEFFERNFSKLYNFKAMKGLSTMEVEVNGEVKKYEL